MGPIDPRPERIVMYVRTYASQKILLLRPSVPSHLSPILRAMRERGGKGRRGEEGINLGQFERWGGGGEKRRRKGGGIFLLLHFCSVFPLILYLSGKENTVSQPREKVQQSRKYKTCAGIFSFLVLHLYYNLQTEHYRTIVVLIYLLTV